MEKLGADHLNAMVKRAKRLKRIVSAQRRNGQKPPPEIMGEYHLVDQRLSQELPWWRSHFGTEEPASKPITIFTASSQDLD